MLPGPTHRAIHVTLVGYFKIQVPFELVPILHRLLTNLLNQQREELSSNMRPDSYYYPGMKIHMENLTIGGLFTDFLPLHGDHVSLPVTLNTVLRIHR